MYVFDIIARYKEINITVIGIAIKYHGTSIVVVNQLILQEHKMVVEQKRINESNIFFII